MRIPWFVVLMLGLPVIAGGAPIFRNPIPGATGVDVAYELRIADFDGDGHDDVLLLDLGQTLVVLLDDGTGPFRPPVVTPIPSYPTSSPGIGDVNGDGRVDVVVSNWITHTIGVMLGNGDGTFSAGPSFVSEVIGGPLAVADFDGDGHPDVAVSSSDSHSSENVVAVYFGDGTGHFSGGTATVVGELVQSLTTADMNGDGKADLVAEVVVESRILIGDGQGRFALMGSATAGGAVVADFDRDGRQDLAIAAGGTHDWFVEVSRGNGDGTLAAPVRYPVGYESDSMQAADVDGDGNLDLLAVGMGVVSVLRGTAHGTFGALELWIAGPGAWQVAAGDFDRDGKADFVTMDNEPGRPGLSFIHGHGDGAFETSRATKTGSVVPVSWPGLRAHGGIAADMNNDGKPDVVIVQDQPNVHNAYHAGVLLNDGSGKLAAPILTGTGLSEYPGMAVGDVNGDGNRDVVLTNGADTPSATLLGDGHGRFAAPVAFSLITRGVPILGQFDGDTTLDLFIAGDFRATVYHGNGDGTFSAAIESGINASHVLAGDLDGDGKDDYISSGPRLVEAYLNDGSGHFSLRTVTTKEVTPAALADFNGDGKLDLLLTDYEGTEMQFGTGDGTFGAPVLFPITPVPNYLIPGPVATADFDGDGKLDAAFGSTVYLGNGDGTFRSRARFRTSEPDSISIADMDGNGSPDLIAMKGPTDEVDVLLTRMAEEPATSSSLVLSQDPAIVRYATAVTFTATVTAGSIPKTGVVAFAIDGRTAAIVAVDHDGKASFLTSFPRGSFTVTATYTGDENHRDSTESRTVTAAEARPTASVVAQPNPARSGQPVTIFVFLQSPRRTDLPGPTGTLTLRDGDTPFAVLPLVNGRVTISTLSPGTHAIAVDYPGDANYEPSTGSTTLVIKPSAHGDPPAEPEIH